MAFLKTNAQLGRKPATAVVLFVCVAALGAPGAERFPSALPGAGDSQTELPEHSPGLSGDLLHRRCAAPDRVKDALHLSFGFRIIPHPDKVEKGGEDACFVGFNCAGVADGVGGWANHGVDAGQYSRQLLKHAEADLLERENPHSELRAVVATAAERTQVEGSSTICLLFLKGETCYAINLGICPLTQRSIGQGDSGFLLLRGDEEGPRVVVRSRPQQHDFNMPYQLTRDGTGTTDTAADAEEYSFQVMPGDVVVLASDVLFDNMYDEDIAEEAFARDEPQERADHLAQLAAQYGAQMQDVQTPFAEDYTQATGTVWNGGKMDDVSVVVANVVSLGFDEELMTDSPGCQVESM